MTRDPMIAIRSAITQFDNAAQEYAFLGAAHPEDRDDIETVYILKRKRLEDLIQKHVKETT